MKIFKQLHNVKTQKVIKVSHIFTFECSFSVIELKLATSHCVTFEIYIVRRMLFHSHRNI